MRFDSFAPETQCIQKNNRLLIHGHQFGQSNPQRTGVTDNRAQKTAQMRFISPKNKKVSFQKKIHLMVRTRADKADLATPNREIPTKFREVHSGPLFFLFCRVTLRSLSVPVRSTPRLVKIPILLSPLIWKVFLWTVLYPVGYDLIHAYAVSSLRPCASSNGFILFANGLKRDKMYSFVLFANLPRYFFRCFQTAAAR
jgi:hypothetical protein